MVTDVVFDFFGTLVWYDPARWEEPIERRAHAFLAEHGLTLGLEEFRATLGAVLTEHEDEARRTSREPHLLDISRAFLARAGLPGAPAALVEGFTTRYVEAWSTAMVPLDGLHGFLAALGPRYRLSVISNTFYPPLVLEKLERVGLGRRFAQVVTSAELGIRKPDPRIFAHALGRLGVRPDRAVFVGDSLETDYLGARAAGWTAYLVDPAGRHPELAEHRLAHLFELADALAAG